MECKQIVSRTTTDNYRRRLAYYGESFRFIQKLCGSNVSLVKTLSWSIENPRSLRRVNALKVVNRCIITGRVAGAGASSKLSRIEFLRLARKGTLINIKKRSR